MSKKVNSFKELREWIELQSADGAAFITFEMLSDILPSAEEEIELPSEAIEFGTWLGFHYYRVSNYKWRKIRNESDTTEYPMVVLYDKFKRNK